MILWVENVLIIIIHALNMPGAQDKKLRSSKIILSIWSSFYSGLTSDDSKSGRKMSVYPMTVQFIMLWLAKLFDLAIIVDWSQMIRKGEEKWVCSQWQYNSWCYDLKKKIIIMKKATNATHNKDTIADRNEMQNFVYVHNTVRNK